MTDLSNPSHNVGQEPRSQTASRAPLAYDVVRWGIAAVLLAAATLKGYALATSPSVSNNIFTSRPVLIAVIEAEFFLAILLLSRWREGNVRWLTAATFVGFGVWSGYETWSGAESCGCFGRVDVDPKWTFILDVLIVCLLCAFEPEKSIIESRRLSRIALGILIPAAALVAIGGGTAMALYEPTEIGRASCRERV